MTFPFKQALERRVAGRADGAYLAWALEEVPAVPPPDDHMFHPDGPPTYAVTLVSSDGKRLWSRDLGEQRPKVAPFLWDGRAAVAVALNGDTGGLKAFDAQGRAITLKGAENGWFASMGWIDWADKKGVLWVFNESERLGLLDQGNAMHWMAYYYPGARQLVELSGAPAVVNFFGTGKADVRDANGKPLFEAPLYNWNDRSNFLDGEAKREGPVFAVGQGDRLAMLIDFSWKSGARAGLYTPEPTEIEQSTSYLRVFDGRGKLLDSRSLKRTTCLGVAGSRFVIAEADGSLLTLE
jgi:hypothetical protein